MQRADLQPRVHWVLLHVPIHATRPSFGCFFHVFHSLIKIVNILEMCLKLPVYSVMRSAFGCRLLNDTSKLLFVILVQMFWKRLISEPWQGWM